MYLVYIFTRNSSENDFLFIRQNAGIQLKHLFADKNYQWNNEISFIIFKQFLPMIVCEETRIMSTATSLVSEFFSRFGMEQNFQLINVLVNESAKQSDKWAEGYIITFKFDCFRGIV
jgi:hypothetical protein